MAVVVSLPCHHRNNTLLPASLNRNLSSLRFYPKISKSNFRFHPHLGRSKHCGLNVNGLAAGSDPNDRRDVEVDDVGVRAALTILRFYKREISPLIPKSCRYVPTCSEYSMEAYKKYGFAKGTILTAWRLCRCNPLGGSGFDPPRWFGETNPPVEEEGEEQ